MTTLSSSRCLFFFLLTPSLQLLCALSVHWANNCQAMSWVSVLGRCTRQRGCLFRAFPWRGEERRGESRHKKVSSLLEPGLCSPIIRLGWGQLWSDVHFGTAWICKSVEVESCHFFFLVYDVYDDWLCLFIQKTFLLLNLTMLLL